MVLSKAVHPPILIALHHKCGNTYFKNVLNEFIGKTPDFVFNVVRQDQFDDQTALKIVPNTITRLRNFTMYEVDQLPKESIVLACKRDPRSLIVSCTDYHMRGREEWTQIPKKKFGGKSYCEYLNSGKNDEERFILSMNNLAGEIIRRMVTFEEVENVLPVKLEGLARDESGDIYHDICRHMKLSGNNYQILYDLLKKHSIWNIKKSTGRAPTHSTSGVSSKSVNRLKGAALEQYYELFGDVHLQLGYD